MNQIAGRKRSLAALMAVAALATASCSSAGGSAPPTAAVTTGGAATASAVTNSAAPSPSAAFHLLTPGVLYVALTDGDLPEIAVGTTSNTLAGTDGFWITQFAQKYNLQLKLFPTTLASEILAVNQGKVDLGTTAFYTAPRAKQVYYTYPFYRDTTGVYTLDTFAYTDPTSLHGKQIGTVSGYVYVPYLQQTYGTDNVHIYSTIAETDAALLNGQISAIINGSGSNPILIQSAHVVFHVLKVGDMGMPDNVINTTAYNYVKCDNSALADALNAVMSDLQASGAWQANLKVYNLTSEFDVAPLQSPSQLCTP
jgi:ABC-type amino acid transport substrate-binding protein